MEVLFTPEQEAQIAITADTDAEHVVEEANPLPVWNLGVIGSLHRREIYHDVR